MSRQFSIQFIGTGNAWSKPPVNYNTNAIIRTQNHVWLLDCGILCPLGLHNLNIPVTDIDGIFISHLHGDHVAGLEELLFINYFAHARRIDLFIPEAFCPPASHSTGSDLWNNCLRAAMETNVCGIDHPLSLDDYASVHTIAENQSSQIFDLPCQLFATDHAGGRPAFGLILDSRIAYTADCTFSRQRLESWLSQGIQTIFHEVSFTSKRSASIHTSFEELATLPPEIAQHIILMHYSDNTTEQDFDTAQKLGFRIARPGSRFDF